MEKDGKPSTIAIPEKTSSSDEKKDLWHINKQTLPYKLHFFFFIGGFGAILPFYSTIGITRYQLTAGNLAAAFTVQQFLVIVLKPLIGYLADYFNRLKAIINTLNLLLVLFYLFMIIIPTTDIQTNLESHHSTIFEKDYNLCNSSDEIKHVSSSNPLIDVVWKEVSECFKSPEKSELEHVSVHCSEEKDNSSHPNDVCYRIFQKSCASSFTILSRNSIQHNLTDVLIIVETIDYEQKSIFVCFLPKDEMLFQKNSYFMQLSEICQPVQGSDFMDLQYWLFNSSLTQISDKVCTSNSPEAEGERHEDSLSAQNFKTYQFWAFSVVLIFCCLCGSAIFTMSDTACYESIQGNDFGRQRLWGAVSWGFMAPLAGFLNDYTGSYFSSWCLAAVCCSFQIWNMSKMNLTKPDFSQSILKDMKTIFNSLEFLAFELGVLFTGVFTGIIWFYMPWFLLKMGGNKLLIGLVHAVQCFLGEIPFMFYSGWMIKKFGHFNCLSLALLSCGIRFLFYSYLYNPWWVLPMESLHGLTFGLFYSAMTSYAKISSKPGTEATTQSILCSTYEGLGAGIGCLVAGISFDYYGGHETFFYTSFLCLAATLINVIFTILIKCRQGKLDVNKSNATLSERY